MYLKILQSQQIQGFAGSCTIRYYIRKFICTPSPFTIYLFFHFHTETFFVFSMIKNRNQFFIKLRIIFFYLSITSRHNKQIHIRTIKVLFHDINFLSIRKAHSNGFIKGVNLVFLLAVKIHWFVNPQFQYPIFIFTDPKRKLYKLNIYEVCTLEGGRGETRRGVPPYFLLLLLFFF